MAFIRSALIMIALHALHLTVLALARFCENRNRNRCLLPLHGKIAAKPSLATSSRSCILRRHSIRRLTKLPKDCLSLGQHVSCGTSRGCVGGTTNAQKKCDPGATGAARWNDPKNFPWTMGWQPNYQTEARIYAACILKNQAGLSRPSTCLLLLHC